MRVPKNSLLGQTDLPAAEAYARHLIGQDRLRALIHRGRLIGLCIEIVHEAGGLQPSAYVSK